MLTKMPDYIIAECGCPHWNRSNSINNNYNHHNNHININNNNNNNNNNRSAKQNTELFVNNSKKLQIHTKDKNHKLLPLRETLNEYYMRIINNNNNCNNNANKNQNRRCESVNALSNGNILSSDPAQQKLQKNKQNECLRQKQTNFYINTKQSNQNILDKSKRDNKKSTTTMTTTTTTTASVDTDLDVF